MAGILTVAQWLGGPDEVKVESTFPSSSRTYAYNFAQDITDWTFKLDYQVVVVDSIAYDRNTGSPNFAASQVIGYFPYGTADTSTNIQVMLAGSGIVNVTHPANLYTGPILPDARANTPIQVMSFTWTNDQTPAAVNTHRIAKILAWEPQVPVGNPTSGAGYTTLI